MKNLVLALSLVAGVAAQADVKPKGAVLDAYCGDADKSTKVCLANVVGVKDAHYVVIRPMKGNPVYLYVANVAKASGSGVAPVTYTSHFPGKDSKSSYIIDRTLTLTTLATKDKKVTADLAIDGKDLAKGVVLEPVVHTASIVD